MNKVFFPAFVALVFTGLLFLFSCAGSRQGEAMSQDEPSFFDTAWELVELNKKEINLNGNAKKPFIRFSREEGKVSGNTGCNGFFGTIELKADQIKFGPVGMTRMWCEGWMEIETAFVVMLDKVSQYEIKGNTLVLLNGMDPVATFKVSDI